MDNNFGKVDGLQ